MERPRRGHEQRALTVGVPLDADHAAAVRRLARRIGLPPDRVPSCPHVSLLVVLDVPDRAAFDATVAEVASKAVPLTVRARGVGVFDDGDGGLVLHVPVVRTEELAALNRGLYDAVTASGGRVDGHYAPASWFPHVTLCAGAAGGDELAAVVAELAGGPPIAWTLPLAELLVFGRDRITSAIPLGTG